MTNDAKAAQAAYMRAWRQRNRDKVRAHNQRYWEKKAAQARESQTDLADYGGGESNGTDEEISGQRTI